MIRKTLIASLFALSACAGTDAVNRDMSDTVDFTAPSNCDLAPYNGEMACDFVSEDGGNRRILLSFNDTVDTEAGAELAPMNAAERTEWFRQLITGIDAGRKTAMPAGYSRTGYRLLPPSETPPGLAACAKSRDVWPGSGGERIDRVHLHCWRLNADPSVASQLLFSYIEYNRQGTPVSASFERDANAVMSTIRVDTR
jgi:hypothetical protein